MYSPAKPIAEKVKCTSMIPRWKIKKYINSHWKLHWSSLSTRNLWNPKKHSKQNYYIIALFYFFNFLSHPNNILKKTDAIDVFDENQCRECAKKDALTQLHHRKKFHTTIRINVIDNNLWNETCLSILWQNAKTMCLSIKNNQNYMRMQPLTELEPTQATFVKM